MLDPLFVPDGAIGLVEGNGQLVFAGANAIITVDPNVTDFRIAYWSTQTAWALGTTPMIIQGTNTIHASVAANLLTANGDETDLGRNGSIWFASGNSSGSVLPPIVPPLFIGDGASGTVIADGQIVFAGSNTTITVSPGVSNLQLIQWVTQTPWGVGTTPTLVQVGSLVHGSVPTNLLNSAGDGLVLALNGATWYSSAPTAGTAGLDIDYYDHTQAAASLTWTITHNLGFKPSGILVEDGAGNDVSFQNATHLSINQLQLTFVTPQAGSAHVS
jgi:hypothetical protein